MVVSSQLAIRHWAPGDAPEAVSAALFDGALLVLGSSETGGDKPRPYEGGADGAIRTLGNRARSILSDTFQTDDPVRAEGRLSASTFRRLALQARRRVADDAEIARLWRAVFGVIGFAAADMWVDRIRLRVVPSRGDIGHGRLQAIAPHRDTWGSGIQAQVNWWMPLYPLADTRTMLVWPELFRRPVPNDSADWCFEAARRGGTLLPTAQAEPPGDGLPVRIAPGELLAFSAAHLHGGITDGSSLTRFGIDTRTVWEADRLAGRGAPNVDGPPTTPARQMWRWFTPPERCAA